MIRTPSGRQEVLFSSFMNSYECNDQSNLGQNASQLETLVSSSSKMRVEKVIFQVIFTPYTPLQYNSFNLSQKQMLDGCLLSKIKHLQSFVLPVVSPVVG